MRLCQTLRDKHAPGNEIIVQSNSIKSAEKVDGRYSKDY